MTELKNLCLPETTFDQIKVVLTYLQIRDHLRELNIPYEDFDNFSIEEVTSDSERINESEKNDCLKTLLYIAKNEIENDNKNKDDEEIIAAQTSSETSMQEHEPSAKKQKIDSVLNTDVRSAILRSPSPSGSYDSDATVDLDFDPSDIKSFKSP